MATHLIVGPASVQRVGVRLRLRTNAIATSAQSRANARFSNAFSAKLVIRSNIMFTVFADILIIKKNRLTIVTGT